MMRYLILVLLFAAAIPARAEVFEIPLPRLEGDHVVDDGSGLTASFDLNRVDIRGTLDVGRAFCPGDGSVPSPVTLIATLPGETISGAWSRQWDTQAVSGSFLVSANLEALRSAQGNLDFLLDSKGELTLLINSVYLGGGDVRPLPLPMYLWIP